LSRADADVAPDASRARWYGRPTVTDFLADAQLAAALAAGAGRLLLDLRASGLIDEELRKAGDHRSNEYLLERLATERPDDQILSEESSDRGGRVLADRVWIIDPLDGTREFGEPDRVDWAVHVALWAEGRLAAGAVALPAMDEVLVSEPPHPLPPPHDGPPRLVVSRTRPPAIAIAVATKLNAELVPMGSAGAKAASVLLGESDVYLHGGGQHEWDSAAPVAVCAGAGLHTSRADGSPLVYNQLDPTLPDLLICRPELAELVLAAVVAAGGIDA
jgi:3'(2'), 5'-bisphosphate nucleotidase